MPPLGSMWVIYHRGSGTHNIGAVLGDEIDWFNNWVVAKEGKDITYPNRVVVTVLKTVDNSSEKGNCVVTLCEGRMVTFSTDWWYSLRPDEYGTNRVS